MSIPSFSLERVFRNREILLEATDSFVGQEVTSGMARDLMLSISVAFLPKKKEVFEDGSRAVHATLASVVSSGKFTRQQQKDLVARLAGNKKAVELGVEIPKWIGNGSETWELAWVQNADIRLGRDPTRRGAYLFLQIVTGFAAGKVVRQYFTTETMDRISATIGVKEKWGMRDVHPSELVGTAFPVLLAKGSELSVEEFAEPAQKQKKANSDLTKARGEDRECPKGYDHPCHLCWMGMDQCPLACHRLTYETMDCECEGRPADRNKFDREKMDFPNFCCQKCPRRRKQSY